MTAYDVMNGNYGITIKEGLITATEVVLVGILNGTYPQNTAEGAIDSPSPQSIPSMPPAASISVPTMSPVGGGEDQSASAGETTKKSLKAMNIRIRVEGLPSSPLHGDDPYNRRRDLTMLSAQERRTKYLRSYNNPLDRQQLLRKGSRSLVYYTEAKPVVITDVQDVLDQACPQGVVCMEVKSTIFVALEEDDVADEIEAVIRSGFQKSLEDSSFFAVSFYYGEAVPDC
jgi:hypothetical protein